MRFIIIIASWLFLLSSCATSYKPRPGGSSEELRSKPIMLLGLQPIIEVGRTDYDASSVLPLLLNRSPHAYELVRSGVEIRSVSNPMKILGLAAMLIGGIGQFQGAQTIGFIGLGSFVGGLGLDIYGETKIYQGVTLYNATWRF
jgi:hypothetical protein